MRPALEVVFLDICQHRSLAVSALQVLPLSALAAVMKTNQIYPSKRETIYATTSDRFVSAKWFQH